MLIALWSATGGAGTSVLTAACGIVLARDVRERGRAQGARVVDLAGDLPAVFGVGTDPDVGVTDWLAAGPHAPSDALDRLLVEVAPGVALLPQGGRTGDAPAAAPEAGAALAMALDGETPVLVDCGTAREPVHQAVIEVADVAVAVLRPCYLALRRGLHAAPLAHTLGVVLLDEPGRALSGQQVSDVLDLPVLVKVGFHARIARAVDAGVLTTRMPDPLNRAASELLRRVGALTSRRGEAA